MPRRASAGWSRYPSGMPLKWLLLKSPRSRVARALAEARTAWKLRKLCDQPKIFGIGRNKTGTTTLKAVFRRHGFVVGDQPEAELLAHLNYFDGRFDWLDTYCQTAEVFQDAPFSWPDTFREVDRRFPGSRFILTVRDDEHQWYDSLVRFQSIDLAPS